MGFFEDLVLGARNIGFFQLLLSILVLIFAYYIISWYLSRELKLSIYWKLLVFFISLVLAILTFYLSLLVTEQILVYLSGTFLGIIIIAFIVLVFYKLLGSRLKRKKISL